MKDLLQEGANKDFEFFDAFAFFGLQPSFFLDEKLLEDTFEGWQKKYHPDQWDGFLAKKNASLKAMQGGQAYQLLKNPLSRAQILLQKRGSPYWPMDRNHGVWQEIFLWQEELDVLKASNDQEKSVQKEMIGKRKRQAILAFAQGLAEDKPFAAQGAYMWMLHLDHAFPAEGWA